MSHPRYTDLLRSLPATVPFVGPEAQERDRGHPFDARLGANEQNFGPSPKAIEAMRDSAAEIWKYPDSTSHDLRRAISDVQMVPPENILVGEGIDGILGYLVRMMIAPGDAVVTSDGAYPTFNYHVAGYGGTLCKVPYSRDHEDPAALFAKAQETGAKLVYLSNPDNPMGSWYTGADIVAAMQNLPADCLLVLDEAYVEFAPEGTAAPLAADDPRVIRMRTFSKAYGMAGARVGYAIGAEPLIRAFDKIRNHFGMNRSAQKGAEAAMRDQAYLTEVVTRTAAARDRIAQIARDNGLTPLPSATNFVSIDCGRDGAFARGVLDSLVSHGVFVRMPGVAPLDRCIRISAGRPEELEVLAHVLPRALAKARAHSDGRENF